MSENRWIYRPEPSNEMVEAIAQFLSIDKNLAYLLAQREITNFEEAKVFFRPNLEQLHDPFLMKDMDKAVERLHQAIENQEGIMVFGDYDVDGTTSVALVYQFLQKFHKNLCYYIPDRYKEGYGVSKQGIDFAKENAYKLIIALDCGVKSVELVEYANTLGVDFIICDHHLPGKEIPKAVAVLDPKRLDCAYPYKELSGCGVGFKLMQGISLKRNIPIGELYQFLDLVVVSIACDIVPITGENRILAFFGLDKLNTKPILGLAKLIEAAGFSEDKDLTITNVVFGIGPRINAAGRIEHASNAVKLLISKNKEEADRFVEQIQENNKDRKEFDQNITKEALEMIVQNHLEHSKSTVLFKNTWHKGVIGIVASRCIEHYHRPTIILTESNGKAAGSARSVPDFDVYEAIEACGDLLEQFGGHKHAAGLSLKLENIKLFQQRFEQEVAARISPEQLSPRIDVDMILPLRSATDRFMRILNQIAPFGPGNMQPTFVSKNVVAVKGQTKLVGKDNPQLHLKFVVKQEDSAEFEAIAFGMAQFAERIDNGESFDICYHLEENTFRDKTNIQLRIKDIKFKN
ncbi:MAG: single-stranded-DNA-specific exonuclease RecJ [Thermonemataceae bacterium]|nr:single-stranded-DNA-specific exonuclease RecJ [Thermonemataceae bacterium]